MPDGGGLDRKITSFVYGLVASVGITYARNIVAKRWGEDSAAYRYIDDHLVNLARDVHDQLTDEQPQRQEDGSDYARGLAAANAKNWADAALYFGKATETGNADAMNWLGKLYLDGANGPPDIVLAAGWFERAINFGDTKYAPDNLNMAGLHFATGKAVAKMLPEATRCFILAVKAGSVPALYNLAHAYRYGLGIAQDRTEARYWFHRSMDKGDADAQAALVQMDAEDNGARQSTSKNNGMTRLQALEILDLRDGATQEDMRASYKRLMLNVHPDIGGSTYFAKQLNAAREVLGF
jgi:TPR repeat protein